MKNKQFLKIKLLALLVLSIFFSCSDKELIDDFDDVIDLSEISAITEEIQSSIQNNEDYDEHILIIVDHHLLKGIQDNLIRFVRDINTNKQNVFFETEVDLHFTEIKTLIKELKEDQDINGCIFIGDVPIPKATFNTPFEVQHTGVSPQYYMDIDGHFEFNDSETIIAHTGNRMIELWLSIIPAYGDDPITNINSYFDKNHKFRTGQMDIQKGFISSLIGAEIQDVATYHLQRNILLNELYNDLTNRGNLFFGIDNKLNDNVLYPDAQVAYLTEMLTNKYDVAKIGAHGTSTYFGSFNEWGSIIVDIDYAKSKNIKPMLLIETSCNTAAIDKSINLASEFLFNPDNNVITYSGASAPQGGKGLDVNGVHASNIIAKNLVDGYLIGEALFSPMYKEYQVGIYNDYREYYSAQQIVLGDGSLKLQEFM